MAAQARHRQAIVDTAVRLFRQQGYAGTGLNQIVAESGAPKGSLYHYFPAGKAAIGAAAVEAAGARVRATLEELEGHTNGPAALVTRYFSLVSGWMKASGFRDGCPITTVLLETAPQDEGIRAAGAAAVASWAAVIARGLERQGTSPARAERLARLVVATLQGALVQARVSASTAPLHEAARELTPLLEASAKAS